MLFTANMFMNDVTGAVCGCQCSRCCDKKSCGNRNETPSDPVVIDRSVVLLIFLLYYSNIIVFLAGRIQPSSLWQVAPAQRFLHCFLL